MFRYPDEIWVVANPLRGDFKQSQHGRVNTTAFRASTALRMRSRSNEGYGADEGAGCESMSIEVQGPLLSREASSDGTPRHFYNTLAMDLSKLGETGTADNLKTYINALSSLKCRIIAQVSLSAWACMEMFFGKH